MRERSGVYGKNQWEQLQNEPGQAPSSHIEPEPMPCSGLYSGVLDAFTRALEFDSAQSVGAGFVGAGGIAAFLCGCNTVSAAGMASSLLRLR